jgi:hypothetical protein
MKTPTEYVVAVVLDPLFGSKLRELVSQFDVWAVSSSVHHLIAEQVWQEVKASTSNHQLTLWSSPMNLELEETWRGILQDIETHHGEYSHNPRVSALEVIGSSATAVAREALRKFNFSIIEITALGFRARKPPLSNSD